MQRGTFDASTVEVRINGKALNAIQSIDYSVLRTEVDTRPRKERRAEKAQQRRARRRAK